MGLVITLLCLLSFFSCASCRSTRSRCSINAIYQFGDSLSDTGNLIRLYPNLPASRLPYGENFPGEPTGRWSDGQLIIDATAKFFGLQLLDPFLDSNASFKGGVNFAIAGATALSSTTLSHHGISVPTVPNLGDQIDWFKAYMNCSEQSECRRKLKNSLVFFGEIGGNEINYGIYRNKSLGELRFLVPSVNRAIIQGLTDMISIGATKLVVPGNFPIGCFPFMITAFGAKKHTMYDDYGCVKIANDFAVYQNRHLQSALRKLRLKFPGVAIMYLDYYNGFMNLLTGARTYGFDERTLLTACCKTEDYDVTSTRFCGGNGVPVCNDPSRYISWDGIHLTQAAYFRIFDYLSRSIGSSLGCK